jgi:hypothetical protein
MIDFVEVMQRMKSILLTQSTAKKVLDKDVAIALKLDPLYYAVMKKRKKIPYESLAYFCKKEKISINWMLLEQKPQYLTS